MQITKVVGCILIILSSALMGFYYSGELKSRVNNLKELRKLIVLLRGDIRYGNTRFLKQSVIARRHEGVFKGFFARVSEKLGENSGSTFAQVWAEAVNGELIQTSLNRKDKSGLVQFGENLGYLTRRCSLTRLTCIFHSLRTR